jgi:hypothetical protein
MTTKSLDWSLEQSGFIIDDIASHQGLPRYRITTNLVTLLFPARFLLTIVSPYADNPNLPYAHTTHKPHQSGTLK